MRATFHVGIDGISLLMVMLTTFLTPLVLISSWNDIKTSVKGYLVSMLLLQCGMLGVFVALDLLLFYVFWEAMLIPMYFLIGIWGGKRRIYATLKFFIYTMVGSLLMLVAILFIYFYYGRITGVFTFDLLQIRELLFPENYQFWLFLAFGLSFAIKVPMFPFHTWLPMHMLRHHFRIRYPGRSASKNGNVWLLKILSPFISECNDYFNTCYLNSRHYRHHLCAWVAMCRLI